MIHSTKARYLVAFALKLGVDGAKRIRRGVGGGGGEALAPGDLNELEGGSGICPSGPSTKVLTPRPGLLLRPWTFQR